MTQAEHMLIMLRGGKEFDRDVLSSHFVEAGMYRYGGVKHQLEKKGHVIRCEPIHKGSKTFRYWLVKDVDCLCDASPLFCRVHRQEVV